MTPTLSIITVTFNAGDLLLGTIQSVQSQSFRDFEHIIIDGGSKDHTIDIIKSHQHLFSYWITEKDMGIYDAMNKGLKAAKGKYVLFLNAGDVLHTSTTLEKVFSNPEADIYYGETIMKDRAGNILGTRSEITTRKLPEDLIKSDMKLGMVVCHQSIIVRRSIAPSYDLNYPDCGDIDWVIRSLENSGKVINTRMIISDFLTGGHSKKNQLRSLKERFSLMKKHFGTSGAIAGHAGILSRALIFWVKKLFSKG